MRSGIPHAAHRRHLLRIHCTRPFARPIASSFIDHLLSQCASDECPLMLSRHPSSICRCRYGTQQRADACSHAAATTPLHDTPYLDSNTPLQHPLTCTRHPEQPETQQPRWLQRRHPFTTPLATPVWLASMQTTFFAVRAAACRPERVRICCGIRSISIRTLSPLGFTPSPLPP